MNPILEEAVVLHRRPYRESSFIVELLTKKHGRRTVVARGARNSKSRAGLLQPFQLLLVSCSGKTDLTTLTQVESLDWKINLTGTQLYCGLYINELLLRCLKVHHPQSDLLDLYRISVESFHHYSEAYVLRKFEWNLLQLLGYGVDLSDDERGNSIEAEQFYHYQFESGFTQITEPFEKQISDFSGKDLLALARSDWLSDKSLQLASRILKPTIRNLVGAKPFASRELYQSLKNQQAKRERNHVTK